MFDNDCPCLITIHIMTPTTVTTSPLLLSLLLLSQILHLLFTCISIRLSSSLSVSSLVSRLLLQSVCLDEKCKSAISWFTLTADEMADIAQIGFTPIYLPRFLSNQKLILLQCWAEDDSSNNSPVCSCLCVYLSYSIERDNTAGVNMPSPRGQSLSGLTRSKHGQGGWTK